MELHTSITGAWDGDNIKVTAKFWNGKVSDTGKLTAGFTVNEIAVDPDMVNEIKQTAAATVKVTRSIDGKTQPKTINYVNLAGTSHITQAAWNLAYKQRGNWANKDLELGKNVVITVPSPEYGGFNKFSVSAPGISSLTSSSNHGNFPYWMNVYINTTNGVAGPFGCNTSEAYQQGVGEGEQNILNQIYGNRNVGEYHTQGKKTVYVPDGYYGQGNITFTIDIGGTGGGGSCCFPAGAPVLLANGSTAPIESLTLGTVVIGYDLDRQEFCDTEVMSTIQKKHRSDIYEIQREDGVSFLMTANHVVLTKNGWKAIDAERGQQAVPDEVVTELTNEDELLRSDGNYIKINNIRYRDDLQDQNVYNIDVEEVDTYIVYDIVVHNECSGGN